MVEDLLNKKCREYTKDEAAMSFEQINQYLIQLKNEWRVIENKKISHIFTFETFKEAITFVNKVADLSESENHHPNIHILYNKVKIDLSTHSIGGISENDFILAAKIENLL